MAPPRTPVRDRLLANHRIDGECWIWTGAKTRDGYGVLGIGRGKQFRAHRVSYATFNGPIPDDARVCHKCDTPLCINPAHLFVGTARENTADMFAKGRKEILRGARHPGAKLTDEQVADIRSRRANGAKLADIAGIYGISFQHVSAIARRAVRP